MMPTLLLMGKRKKLVENKIKVTYNTRRSIKIVNEAAKKGVATGAISTKTEQKTVVKGKSKVTKEKKRYSKRK